MHHRYVSRNEAGLRYSRACLDNRTQDKQQKAERQRGTSTSTLHYVYGVRHTPTQLDDPYHDLFGRNNNYNYNYNINNNFTDDGDNNYLTKL